MKVELFPFQKMALFQLRRKTAEALGSYQRTHTPQVLSFTAPTGAGKTIILASLIESIYFGDEEYPDQPDAIFVWLSDSPELNEQSRSKIDLKADKIRLGQCATITDESFDQEMLDDGHMLQLLPLLRMLFHPLVCSGGSFRVHFVYPAPVRLKFFVRLSILEGHELTALSAFTKSLQFQTFRFCEFSLSNNRRTISPG